MATGALDSNGIWQYGEDDSNTTFSALLNRLGSSTSTQMAKALFSGRIIQTVTNTTSTAFTTTSNVFVNTNLTASITPRYSTSKIFVVVTQSYDPGASNTVVGTITRNGTNLGNATWGLGQLNTAGVPGYNILDSPATTSAVVYRTQIRSYASTLASANVNGSLATMTLLEVAA